MQTSSQFRKPSSPLKSKHPNYITSQQCATIGCTMQEVGSSHSLETTKHSPLGLAFLTSMFQTALNKSLLPHTWKLANIVPIPKPNKDTNKGTSYRPISLLSVIAKTLEKSLLPYITANIPMHHGYKTQHSTVTALHTLNNTVAKGFNQMAPLARTITVALDMSNASDTINIHTLIRKLIQTNIPGTIIKLLLLSTHSHVPCYWGESDVPACGPPASFSVHLVSSAVTPVGSVHKSRGDNVVSMWVQLKR